MEIIDVFIRKKRFDFRKFRVIFVNHIMLDSFQFINGLQKAGADVDYVLGKNYSADEEIANKIIENKIELHILPDDDNEKEKLALYIINEAISKSQVDKKRIIIFDLGGVFSNVVNCLDTDEKNYIAGVVEDTAFGHRKYNKLINTIQVPIFSVATSELKELEAKFVGESVVDALRIILKDIGISISGRNVLVLGYGMIGKNVVNELRKRDCMVSTYDINYIRELEAHLMGYNIGKLEQLVRNNEIIIGTTGYTVLDYSKLRDINQDIYLVSASSNDIEFDVSSIENNSILSKESSDVIRKYQIPGNKNTINLLNYGKPINFLVKSIPNEIISLVFAEMLFCANSIINDDLNDISSIRYLESSVKDEIAKEYLRSRNMYLD